MVNARLCVNDVGVSLLGILVASGTVHPANMNPRRGKKTRRMLSLSFLEQVFQVGYILGGTTQDVEGRIGQEDQTG